MEWGYQPDDYGFGCQRTSDRCSVFSAVEYGAGEVSWDEIGDELTTKITRCHVRIHTFCWWGRRYTLFYTMQLCWESICVKKVYAKDSVQDRRSLLGQKSVELATKTTPSQIWCRVGESLTKRGWFHQRKYPSLSHKVFPLSRVGIALTPLWREWIKRIRSRLNTHTRCRWKVNQVWSWNLTGLCKKITCYCKSRRSVASPIS